jgi:hypothetical protein
MVIRFNQTREPSVDEISMIGVDLAKNIFRVHGVDASGKVALRRRWGGKPGMDLLLSQNAP